jgi:hypothetical protein
MTRAGSERQADLTVKCGQVETQVLARHDGVRYSALKGWCFMKAAIYLKSCIAGLVAAVVLAPVGLILFVVLSTPRIPGVSHLYDLRSLFSFGKPWLAVILIFVTGFLWEFRRASR